MAQQSTVKQWLDYGHMTQKELAKKMGVSQSFISYYANKTGIKYRYATAEKFANAFDVSYDEFLQGPPGQGESNAESGFEVTGNEDEKTLRLRIIDIVMSTDAEDLKLYYNLLNRLIQGE